MKAHKRGDRVRVPSPFGGTYIALLTECGIRVGWNDTRATWRGAPVKNRCKNCLRAERKAK